jgi:phosphoribosylglycinamide formyltransferase-1
LSRIKLGVLASGRGSNLQALIDSMRGGRLDAEIAVVISDVEEAFALERARAAGIPAHYVDPGPKKSRLGEAAERKIVETLEAFGVDLIALAGFMRIVGAATVQRFRLRIMNIHPSLLPSFQGLHAQKQALDYGVKYSGCTVHFVDEGVDTGPIIIQVAVPVLDSDTEESLSERILKEEHRIYTEAINLFAAGRLRVEGRKVVVWP